MLLQKFFKEENIIECGCDEAGRGCLAGPVVAAAVVLPRDFDCKELNDSKQLTDSKRRLLRPIIEEKAVAWAVAFVDNETIDRINIL
ncbi:MAG: ribonuclease HII, partial [Bacteroidales bacterium]|nr:ribonuclease HII [Bacteroidales bacterium]